MSKRLKKSFYLQSAEKAAPLLLGKILVRRLDDGTQLRYAITETECYCGVQDTACHAHKGRTARTEMLFREGGSAYVYMIYGLHFLLNVVTGSHGSPEAVLIRGLKGVSGPARLTKLLMIDKDFNGEDLIGGNRLWIEDGPLMEYDTAARVGIDYADEPYRSMQWRFIAKP